MKCTKCGNELKDGVKFCPQCGEAVKEVCNMKCRKCGKKLNENVKFCSACGTKVEYDSGEKSKGDVESLPEPNRRFLVKVVVGAILCFMLCFFASYFYKEAKLQASIKKATEQLKTFEYNEVEIYCREDESRESAFSDIAFYKEKPFVLDHFEVPDVYASFYYADNGELNCITQTDVGVDTFPMGDIKICSKDKFDKLLQGIDNLKVVDEEQQMYSESAQWYSEVTEENAKDIESLCDATICMFEDKAPRHNIEKIEINICVDNSDDDVSVEDAVFLDWSDAYGDRKYSLTLRKKTIQEQEEYTVEDRPFYSRFLRVHEDEMLNGEYYQPNTGDMLIVPSDSLSVDGDLRCIYSTIILNGEEKKIPYSSLQWADKGCYLDGVEYVRK